ncbi:GPI mannosyltransferase [Macleaya cordata]|uniref:Mannosyltransferase n=1 Tax=Macleaya cordata TaxID=56857 RepID=A0A200QLF8_MACCD|nr:GPI mannosyltransferase [Macleaya cordata]
MSTEKPEAMNYKSSKFLQHYGWDLLLGSIAAFYVFMVPYTKVEESFNVQAMHDVLYHRLHIERYDHLEFPGVVPRTFIGALLVSLFSSPVILAMHILNLPKLYSLFAVRMVLGCIILSTLRFFRVQVRRIFGYQVEAFFVTLTACQFHMLFYCTRPLPNILASGLVNLAYGFWLKGHSYQTLRCLIFATIVFRCDMVLLLGPIGLELLLSKSISLWEAIKCCISTTLLCIGLTILVDTVMWQNFLWPEFEVFWFNSILNRSSEWGTHAFHWYFTSALPRALLAAYPLSMLGLLLERRILRYILPVLSFILLYSKLPHKELRFIIGAIPFFNLSAAIAATRLYNNRKKGVWKWFYFVMIGSLVVSLGCSIVMFLASYENYPSGYALKDLHWMARENNSSKDQWVHIDTFSAMNGISRFCENNLPWSRYSKEEGIATTEYRHKNFTYLLNEHSNIDGFKCLHAVDGFSRFRIQIGFPPILLLKEPRVFIHGNMNYQDILHSNWPGCP